MTSADYLPPAGSRTPVRQSVRKGAASLGFLTLATTALVAAVVSGSSITTTVGLGALAVAATVVLAPALVRWQSLLTVLLLLIMFVPIRRYTLSTALPFELEPYRIYVALLVALWIAALLLDPRVRLRGTGLEGPMCAVLTATLGSIIVNTGRIADLGLQQDVAKKLTFFVSFLLVFYVVVTVAGPDDVDLFAKVLVASGAIVAASALIEFRTDYNAFAHLNDAFPFLQEQGSNRLEGLRGGRLRVQASAQHPIALGAMLIMLVPISVYLAANTRKRLWWLMCALITLGALASISRTTIVMGATIIALLFCLKPRAVLRLWPLIPIALVVIHLVLPGALGSFKDAFFPQGGIVAEQQSLPGWEGSGRLADLGPALRDAKKTLLLGQGFGTRIVDDGPKKNAPILDDQWLQSLLETGLLGVIAWAWLIARSSRRSFLAAQRRADLDRLLLGAIAGSTAAFGVGMLFYDAFSFIQVTFVLFVLLALGVLATRNDAREATPNVT